VVQVGVYKKPSEMGKKEKTIAETHKIRVLDEKLTGI